MSELKKKTYYSPAHNKANKKWEAGNIYKASVKFPKSWEEMIRLRADEVTGGSVSAYLKLLVENDLFSLSDEPSREIFMDAP